MMKVNKLMCLHPASMQLCSHINGCFVSLLLSLWSWETSNQIKVYLSCAPNTTGVVDLTVKCLLTGSNQ